MDIFIKILMDSFAIAIVSFVINASMCKLFAKKHNYEIRSNQVTKKISIIYN